MRPPPTKPRHGPAIVTTLRNVGPSLDSFVAYHLAIGFNRLYLFFDDPADPDIARVAGNNRVTVVKHDEALRQTWKSLPSWAAQAPFVEHEVMARQVMNAALAMKMARAAGHSWLLHIDADELFYSPLETAAQHFERLEGFEVDMLTYGNYEAITEGEDILDPFRQVTLFKSPEDSLTRRYTLPQLKALTADVPQLLPRFFNFYCNGKSAVRLSSPDMEPSGVHQFGRRSGCSGAKTQHQFILHYACAGFQIFLDKYKTLGNFSNVWWNHNDIAKSIGDFHLRARDAVCIGDVEAARQVYRSRMVITDRSKIDRLLATGIMERVTGPSDLLSGIKPPR